MKYKIKNMPLFLQIYFVIILITISIAFIMMISLPHTLRSFFTEEMYNTINSAQSNFIQPEILDSLSKNSNEDIRTVKHIILLADGSISSQVNIPLSFVNEFQINALYQKSSNERYIYDKDNLKLFYVIRKIELENNFLNIIEKSDGYLISFLNDSYREDLVGALFKKIISLSILISAMSFIPSLFLSKYISKPLVDLEVQVDKLSHREWSNSINIDRKDEIGKLGTSIEKLRLELLREDNLQQNFLQNISHELKTPIMVIKSYSEAIRDGIYPGGSLESTLDIIEEETNRLENKVKSLLYITKLDYMENFKLNLEKIDLKNLIDFILKKYRSINHDINFINNISNLEILGDREQISIVFENILDNMVRYAKSEIILSNKNYIVEIFNDGKNIPNNIFNNIFNKFHKGEKGEVGLGLSIVKKIILLHGFTIYAKNLNNGVSFFITFKKE